VFVAALSRGIIVAGSSIQAAGPYPAPSAPAPCTSALLKAASSNPSAVRKQLEEWHKDLGKLFE
jgi:hypothetical protein